MMELLTAAEMRAVEKAAISSGEVTGSALMERAGQGVVEAIFVEWPKLRSNPHSAVVLCGPGNNGGDGFVIARLLRDLGWQVRVFFFGSVDRLPPDARLNHDRWADMAPVEPLKEDALRASPAADLYIDALFGTGLTRPISDALAGVIRHIAGRDGDLEFYRNRLVAVDVPSGLCADSGRVLGGPTPSIGTSHAPFARLTVTFHAPKVGHFLKDGPALCGKLVVADIGLDASRAGHPTHGEAPVGQRLVVPLSADQDRRSVKDLFDPQDVLKTPHVASNAAHKYTYGHALVVSGGPDRTGAARLAARGALRVGAGLVTLAVPPAAQLEVATQITAIMLTRVRDGDDLRDVLKDPRLNALCLGPGLGIDDRGADLLETALTLQHKRSIVLDADALTLLAQEPGLAARLHDHCVLTPHGGEFARLFPGLADRLAAEQRPAYSKLDAAQDAARQAGCTVLLKGADTCLSDGCRRSLHAALYDRAAPWLATAGSGDVLAGMITGLLARGMSAMKAAEAAAWLHVEAALQFGPGLIAEDLPEMLPSVFAKMRA